MRRRMWLRRMERGMEWGGWKGILIIMFRGKRGDRGGCVFVETRMVSDVAVWRRTTLYLFQRSRARTGDSRHNGIDGDGCG